jgi:hypothetical protein
LLAFLVIGEVNGTTIILKIVGFLIYTFYNKNLGVNL